MKLTINIGKKVTRKFGENSTEHFSSKDFLLSTGCGGNKENSPTRQLTDTVFETIHRQIFRQLTDTL